MLSQAQRTTILELDAQKVSKHEIARVLGISRASVRKVLRSKSAAVPEMHRPEKAEPYRQQVLDLFPACKGNLVRVHEDLLESGASLPEVQGLLGHKRVGTTSRYLHIADPERARAVRASAPPRQEDVCTMCGDFCAMKGMSEYLKKEN